MCGLICISLQACRTQKQNVRVETSSGMHFQSTSVCERGTLTVIKPHVQLPDVLTSSMVGEAPRETLKIIYANYRDSIIFDTINVEIRDTATTITVSTDSKERITFADKVVVVFIVLCVTLILFFGLKFARK